MEVKMENNKRFCPKCGTLLNSEWKFCKNCGFDISKITIYEKPNQQDIIENKTIDDNQNQKIEKVEYENTNIEINTKEDISVNKFAERDFSIYKTQEFKWNKVILIFILSIIIIFGSSVMILGLFFNFDFINYFKNNPNNETLFDINEKSQIKENKSSIYKDKDENINANYKIESKTNEKVTSSNDTNKSEESENTRNKNMNDDSNNELEISNKVQKIDNQENKSKLKTPKIIEQQNQTVNNNNYQENEQKNAYINYVKEIVYSNWKDAL
ncbi:MAG: zinc ribbon domain-containing protein [Sphingobacterium sp.]|nr:zinc ribbon domain-containing protein [Sphingobacterium sp.]